MKNLNRHYKSKKHQRKLNPSKFPLKRNNGKYHCEMCDKGVANLKLHHKSTKHLCQCCELIDVDSALGCRLKTYTFGDIKTIDPILFLSSMREQVKIVRRRFRGNTGGLLIAGFYS